MKIVGLDFSINKPAACLYNEGTFDFISWPFGLTYEKEIFREAGVSLFDREDEKYKGTDSSESTGKKGPVVQEPGGMSEAKGFEVIPQQKTQVDSPEGEMVVATSQKKKP